jgi:hypothetical protein
MDALVRRLGAVTLSDADGRSVALGSLWERRPIVLAFLRHFG